jgi:hypothetical protein
MRINSVQKLNSESSGGANSIKVARLSRSMKSAIRATFLVGVLWNSHASASPTGTYGYNGLCLYTDQPCEVVGRTPDFHDVYYIGDIYSPSFWDWAFENDANPYNDWSPTNGDFGGGGQNPVCAAIRSAMPQDCGVDDIYRAEISLDVSDVGVSRFSGLGFAIEASHTWFATPAANINNAISEFIDNVSLIPPGIDSTTFDSLMAGHFDQLITDIGESCPGMGAWMFFDIYSSENCRAAVAVLSAESGRGGFLSSLMSSLGITSISYPFAEAQLGGNSLQLAVAAVAHRNQCATGIEALERNGCL